jgi:uncharacterized protein (TIGR00266 family)
MQYEIKGTTMPALEIHLTDGESVFTEIGEMSWMSHTIDMSTGTRGGLGGILNRVIAGESILLTTYACKGPQGVVAFTPHLPGQIIPVRLAEGQSVIAEQRAFMAAEDGVKLEVHFKRRLGSGLFGGEGFILQKLTGPGTAFIEVGGEIVEYNLAQGQTLRVNPGHIAMYEPTIDYDIHVLRGIRNLLFGEEGLFLAALNGPGKVWLQTMPFSSFMGVVLENIPKPDPEALEKLIDQRIEAALKKQK